MQWRGLNELAAAELADLRAAGIQPTDAEIVKVNEAAWRVARPGLPSPACTGRPVQVGKAWLWPFTIQAGEWFHWALEQGFSERQLFLCLAFALAHGREHGRFSRIYSKASAWAEVRRWSRGLGVTAAELNEAIEAILEQDPPQPPPLPDAEPVDWDQVLATVAATAGVVEAGYWESRVSRNHVYSVLRTIAAQHKAEDGPPDPGDPTVCAERELGRLLIEIRERHKAEAERNG